MPPLNICLQVNIDAESSKSGIEPGEVQQLAEQVLPLTPVEAERSHGDARARR